MEVSARYTKMPFVLRMGSRWLLSCAGNCCQCRWPTGIKKSRFYSILYILCFPGPVLSVNVRPEKLDKKIQGEMKITIYVLEIFFRIYFQDFEFVTLMCQCNCHPGSLLESAFKSRLEKRELISILHKRNHSRLTRADIHLAKILCRILM